MQPYEGVSRGPVPTRRMRAVDDNHPRIGFGDERVGERHSHCTGSHHEVIGFNGFCWRLHMLSFAHRYGATLKPLTVRDPPSPWRSAPLLTPRRMESEPARHWTDRGWAAAGDAREPAGVPAEQLRVYDWLGCMFEEAP
ncbi:hypothetical protein MSHO_44760 [Mycobacterium shottsii]|uniref:Uncharacterized protein n=1 Tax=Mycobacterium shottsii TaxID=133549 RepID=A0A7I7LGK0_9MYCO|nr:hypothetical protein MSHO_44760 [Mycobacterium shottsii]